MVVADHEVKEDGLDDRMQKWIVLCASIGEIQEQFDAVAELTSVRGRVHDLAVALVHHSDHVGRAAGAARLHLGRASLPSMSFAGP